MRGTRCADLSVETFATTAALPSGALVLLDQSTGIFASRGWWDVVQSHAMPAGAEAAFMIVRSMDQVLALLPMLRTGGRLQSLTTPYSCEYTPLFAAGLDQNTRIAAMTAFARACRRSGIVRLDAIPAEWDGLADLETGARGAGLRPIRFDHFGNWYEDVVGLDWATYLRRRPGALRETIRRRSRRAAALPDARFDLFTRPAEMARATEVFESVYQRSWKDREPFPSFNAALMRSMADQGLLRLAVWSIAAEAVAVQFWVVKDGAAIVLKLAHDEAYKAHSPGTVLTALILRHLLDTEHVSQIDFGRGDDPYKPGWATRRRQRIGLLLADPWQLSGAMALLRQTVGRIRRGVVTNRLQAARSA
jgi:CelD/BcsL family acetyltransferase involved in cellulose biosynthesis